MVNHISRSDTLLLLTVLAQAVVPLQSLVPYGFPFFAVIEVARLFVAPMLIVVCLLSIPGLLL
ncbi:hypothetical protein BBR01nite_58530 [Brevibacillus brevis]|uniref:hypothetical protein n=1 Tax=Brevibacillus brevis TaxID=1393 RepID=UPI001173F0E9|nr:hypothetical protein BBR01nite_58530 [Brevibacillus brevis]